MRSLIKVNLESNQLESLEFEWEKDTPYQIAIAKMFDELGYKNISLKERVWEDDKSLKERVWEDDKSLEERVWEAVPGDIKVEERERVVYSSYTSSGQAHFVVAAITKDIIHIRCVANTFIRISKACEEINNRFIEHENKHKAESINRYMGHEIKHEAETIIGKVDPHISVLEHSQSLPTINGTIMDNPFKWCYKNTKTYCWLFLAALGLIWFSYHKMPSKWLQSVFPALTVMVLTNLIPIIVEFTRIFRTRPIHWDNKLE